MADETYEYDLFDCPHCSEQVIIYKAERNCHIFRHGVFINGGMQIPPHASKELCDAWVAGGLIFGCGKPFRIVVNAEQTSLEICDYI